MARTKKNIAEEATKVVADAIKKAQEENFKEGIQELEKDAQVEAQKAEVKYIKCEIVSADVDTVSNIVTLTLEDVGYQSNISLWFVEDYKPMYYTMTLDMAKDADRQLVFDKLIKYCYNCLKYKTIIDKIQKGLVGKTWNFPDNKLIVEDDKSKVFDPKDIPFN